MLPLFFTLLPLPPFYLFPFLLLLLVPPSFSSYYTLISFLIFSTSSFSSPSFLSPLPPSPPNSFSHPFFPHLIYRLSPITPIFPPPRYFKNIISFGSLFCENLPFSIITEHNFSFLPSLSRKRGFD